MTVQLILERNHILTRKSVKTLFKAQKIENLFIFKMKNFVFCRDDRVFEKPQHGLWQPSKLYLDLASLLHLFIIQSDINYFLLLRIVMRHLFFTFFLLIYIEI